MPIVATVAVLAALVWGAVYARRGSLLVGCLALVLVQYVLGYWFWHYHVGPVPLTLDRILFVGLVGAFVAQWRWHKTDSKPLSGADWLLVALLAILSASCFANLPDQLPKDIPHPLWRLVASFWMPAVIYWIARQSPLTPRVWRTLLAGMACLGVYLALTAFAETTQQWWAVFPRYIADPQLGTHFGRARGPILNSVSLGLALTTCLWCAWTLCGQVSRAWKLLLFLAVLLMTGGIFLTYTRSIWMGLAASGVVWLWCWLPRQWRLPVVGGTAVAGLLIAAIAWGSIVNLRREGTAAESHHSVTQREAFLYVSMQMFKDHPLLGVGFGRFYDQKMPYLSDRSQDFELESIRPLHHHNTFLSLLTETGMLGLAAFVALLVAWARTAWRLASSDGPQWVRSHGLLMLTLLAAYLPTLVFHDVTHLPTEIWALFAMAGVTVGLARGGAREDATADSTAVTPQPNQRSFAPLGGKVSLFGMQIDRTTMPVVRQQVLDWCRQPRGEACRYVVTPNVDHVVMFQHRSDLRRAYDDAALVLADGAPVVWASRLLGKALPERVAGSDLVPQLLAQVSASHNVQNDKPLRVFLLGAAPGVAEEAARRIHRQHRGVEIVGTYSPPLGFERNAAENAKILERIATAEADLLVVGLGAPKQELWVQAHHQELQAKVALCVGATIDFLAGHRQRSPVWMQRTGLEWLHRVLSEPRRLAARYARDAWIFPQLMWREMRQLH